MYLLTAEPCSVTGAIIVDGILFPLRCSSRQTSVTFASRASPSFVNPQECVDLCFRLNPQSRLLIALSYSFDGPRRFPPSVTSSVVFGLPDDIEEADLGSSATRLVWPPQARCVAAANGWIVAVVECGPPPNAIAMPPPAPTSSSASSSSHVAGVGGGVPEQHPPSKLGLVALIPPLRLVSRWNVRRGTTLGSDGNHLVPLPPPVRATADADTTAGGGGVAGGGANDPNFGRVAHAFVDPTGCHVLLSARNGEAYYLHSTSKAATKLGGFGPGADGSYAGYRAGATLAEATVGGGEAAAVQTGLTPGSYVTAVGWDR